MRGNEPIIMMFGSPIRVKNHLPNNKPVKGLFDGQRSSKASVSVPRIATVVWRRLAKIWAHLLAREGVVSTAVSQRRIVDGVYKTLIKIVC